MAMQNMCKHATYYTDKISSSYLFVFCVRLKTFQPPLVYRDPTASFAFHLSSADRPVSHLTSPLRALSTEQVFRV